MVVGHLPVGPEREIRGDESPSPCEAALPLGDFPDHGAVPEPRDRARAGHSLPDRSKRDPTGVAVTDRARLDERALPGHLNLRLENSDAVTLELDRRPDLTPAEYGAEHLARGPRSRSAPALGAGERPGASSELQGEDELSHRSSLSPRPPPVSRAATV